jgi:hypothetical protein
VFSTLFDKFQSLLIAAFLTLGLAGPLLAQQPADDAEEPAPESGPPVAVLNVAGVERILDDVDYLFGSVDRSDMTDVVNGLLGNVGDLKGLERGKPFGVMLFLNPGVLPQPVPVGYLPVADAAALAKTVEIAPNTVVKKVSEGRYELIGARRTMYARLTDGYAFVAAEEDVLDRVFPDPLREFAGLSTRYDVAVEARPENMPSGMRDLFLNLMRTRAQADLQQRDDESDASYAVRKSQGLNNLRMVEAFLKETRSVTLGIDASRESHKAVLEIVVDAVPNTPYLEALQSVADEPSRFDALLDDDVPLSISMNSKIDAHAKKVNGELLDRTERQTALFLTRLDRKEAPAAEPVPATPGQRKSEDPDPAAAALAARLFGPIKEILRDGNMDAFLQFQGDSEKKFVILAGVEIPGAAGLESAVREFIDRIRPAAGDFDKAVELQYGATEAAGVSLHRLALRETPEELKRFYGDSPALYVGFDGNAVWLAAGGPRAVEALTQAITRVKEAGPVNRSQPAAPFQLTVTANRWIGLGKSKDFSDLAHEAFDKGDDKLRVDFRPTEHGGRFRIEAEEGFLRLLGLGVAKRYDRSQL